MQRRKVKTKEELVAAYKDPTVNEIEVQGDAKTMIVHIRAKGKAAMVIAIGCIIVGVGLIITSPTSGGAAAAPGSALLGPSVLAIGATETSFLVGLAVATTGTGVGFKTLVNWLCSDNVVEETDDYLVIRKPAQ